VTLPLLSSSLALSVDNSGPRPPVGVEDPAGSLRCHGLKVLVVDDDEDTCEILGVILEQAGAEVRMCVSATQALTAMDSWVPDILVSDIAMPGEDGYTLIRKVRARKTEVGGAVPAVALSAYGRDEDRTKALSAGFQVHVGKPVAPSRLIDIVATMAGHGGGAQSSRASNPGQ
jgi:CheY-like chemotaxis protein